VMLYDGERVTIKVATVSMSQWHKIWKHFKRVVSSMSEHEKTNFSSEVNLQGNQQEQVESVVEGVEESTEAFEVESAEVETVQEVSTEAEVEAEAPEVVPPIEARTMRVGVILYHRATESRYEITCTISPGNRNITVDGVPIDELIERNYIAPISPLIEHMRSERIAGYDLDIRVGNLEWCQKIDPLVIAYALSQALINIISSL